MHACPRCRSDLTSQTVISHLWPLSVTRSKRSKTKELLNMKSAESCCLAAAELALQPNPRGCDEVWIHTFTTSQRNLQRPVPPAPTWTATLWFYECLHHTLKDENFKESCIRQKMFSCTGWSSGASAVLFLFEGTNPKDCDALASPAFYQLCSCVARLSAQCLKILAAANSTPQPPGRYNKDLNLKILHRLVLKLSHSQPFSSGR